MKGTGVNEPYQVKKQSLWMSLSWPPNLMIRKNNNSDITVVTKHKDFRSRAISLKNSWNLEYWSTNKKLRVLEMSNED